MTQITLDAQQKAAVETQSPRTLVAAGAGSGKTRVLTERIAYLCETQKVSPSEIMAFTFTRKAAGEMKVRLATRLGPPSYRVRLGTMHATALSYLMQFGDVVGFRPKNITVYSEWEEQFLLKKTAEDVDFFKGKSWKLPKKEIDKAFKDYYERGILPDPETDVYILFSAFNDRCKQNNAFTYGGLLSAFMDLLPHIKQYLGDLRHLMVDEVQDTDTRQWSLINTLCEITGCHLFVVGDTNQAIFSWRGAVPEYLIDHQEEFVVYRLETNYRSVPSIVKAGNSLISHNEMRIPIEMRPNRNDDLPVSVERDIDSEGVARLVADYLKMKVPPPDMAVLARNHVLLKKLSSIMAGKRIKHVYIGKKTALTNSEEFRRFHAFLKLIVNPYDNFAFLLIRDLVGIDTSDYNRIRLKSITQRKSHLQVWLENMAPSEYRSFFQIEPTTLPSGEEKVLAYSLAPQAMSIKYMATGAAPYNGERWDFDVEEVFQFVMEWCSTQMREQSPNQVKDYLEWLATYDIQDDVEAAANELQLMTIHAAKGLEWPLLIVAGMNEGILPSKQSLGKEEDVEAERRLAYVAMTRAEKSLVLTVRAERVEKDGRLYNNPESRFVAEAGVN